MAERHAERDHATWSASASERRWACPGSLVMEQHAPADTESHAAAWGTAAHEVAETALRTGTSCFSCIGDIVHTKSNKIEVDEEIAETAQEYVDYVRGQLAETTELLIEQRFSLASLKPPFDAGGTGDAVLLKRAERQIEVVDLKGGRGVVVEALENKQLRTYGLGALLANRGNWDTVKVTIVQPRAPHRDGRIRSETIDVADLYDWTVDLQDAMASAKGAADGYASHGPGAEWAQANLRAGDHCMFCRAAPTCPALQEKAVAAAQTFFAPVSNEVQTPPAPSDLEMDKIVKVLDAADMIENWLKAVRRYAQEQAEAGVEIPGYVLVPKSARRKWAQDDAETIDGLAKATGKPRETFVREQPVTFGQLKKLIGKDESAVEHLWTKESSGLNLVRSDKTTREAVTPPAQQFFQPTKE